MGEESDSPGQSALFRLRSCPGCDYSLETLPAEGVCPECGRRYDQRFVVMTGQGRGRWEASAGGTWRGLVWQGVWIVLLLWLFSGGMRGINSLQRAAIGVMAGGILVAQLYGRLFSSRDPGMQLWVSPEGVAQVPSTPEARRAQWMTEGMSLFFGSVFYAGIVLGGGPGSGGFSVTFFAFLMVIAVAEWRRRRKRAGKVEGDDFTPGLWSWREIERIQVKELAGDRARVRCMVKRWWGPIVVRDQWPIDIEVACPAKVAEALGRQMVAWCPKARAEVP